MNNEEILKKAIEKALENGWQTEMAWMSLSGGELAYISAEHKLAILFNHEWAKAFWGKGRMKHEWNKFYFCGICKQKDEGMVEPECRIAWQYYQHRLLDLIQEDKDPISYLEKFL